VSDTSRTFTPQFSQHTPGIVSGYSEAGKPTWATADGVVQLWLLDCLTVMPTLTGIDLIVTDPPYGISHPTDYASRGRGKLAGCRDYGKPVWNNPRSNNYSPMIHGDDKPYDPSALLAMKVPTVLWGGNHFADKLPASGRWLVWDKRRPDGLDQATCELAWTNCVKGVRRFEHLWNGMMRASEHGENYHPTQKPVALFDWTFSLPWIPKGTVFDPYMGSGPCGVSAVRSGLKYVGCELSPDYFWKAVARIEAELNRAPLFEPKPQVQRELLA
jgi:hypothetical protein